MKSSLSGRYGKGSRGLKGNDESRATDPGEMGLRGKNLDWRAMPLTSAFVVYVEGKEVVGRRSRAKDSELVS